MLQLLSIPLHKLMVWRLQCFSPFSIWMISGRAENCSNAHVMFHWVPLGSPAHFRTRPLPAMCLMLQHLYVTFSNMLWLMQKEHWQLCSGSVSNADHRLKAFASLILNMTNVYISMVHINCPQGHIFYADIHHGWGAHPAVVSKQGACLVGTKVKKNQGYSILCSTWPKIYSATCFVRLKANTSSHKHAKKSHPKEQKLDFNHGDG